VPVDATAENEITLPTGGTVRLLDTAIRRDLKVTVTCDRCKKVITWSQLDVATDPNALPEEAKAIVKFSTFDGQEQVFCNVLCLLAEMQEAQTEAQSQARFGSRIHRVK